MDLFRVVLAVRTVSYVSYVSVAIPLSGVGEAKVVALLPAGGVFGGSLNCVFAVAVGDLFFTSDAFKYPAATMTGVKYS